MKEYSLEPDFAMPVCSPDLTALLVPIRTLRSLVCLALSPVWAGKGTPGCHVCWEGSPSVPCVPTFDALIRARVGGQLAGCLEKSRGRVGSDFMWLPIGSLTMEYSVTIRHSLAVVVKLQR